MTRAIGLARLAAGMLLLGRAPQVVGRLERGPAPALGVPLVRVLGLREVVQGGVLAARPSRDVVRAGGVVDGLHLATMLAAAAGSARYRRLAGAAAAQAAVELTAGLVARSRPGGRGGR